MKLLIFISLIFLSGLVSFSQSVAINTDGSVPNNSAILDVKSFTKGMLLPRTSTTSRLAIVNPAKGLILYDTTAAGYYFYNGSAWTTLSGSGATNYWSLNGTNISNSNTGNVGIGLNTPLAPLHIKSSGEAFRIEGASPYLSFYDNASNLKSFILNSNNDLYVGMPASNPGGSMQLAVGSGPAITMLPSGNVGIGTTTPDEKLTVQTLNNSYGILHRGEGGNLLATRMGGTSAGIGTFSNTNMRIFAGGNSAMFINSGDSYVGVGVDFPTNKLQVGSMGSTGYSGNNFAFGDGINALRMYQTSTVSLIASSADILFWPKEKAGHVGVNCIFPPGNKLQVGDMGPAGYNGNDIAFGNGTQATAIAQTSTSSQFASTTNFAFLPKYGIGGGVGINTGTPRFPLEVAGFITKPSSYYSYLNRDAWTNGVNNCQNCLPAVSIFAANAVYAAEFDAFSDARIKNLTGTSNSASDLQVINAMQIRDYTMKDRVKYGSKQFKKVIAQEVEKIYPQIVSKHTDFIPNVYQVTSSIKQTAKGSLLSFSKNHHISSNAKKLQIILESNAGMKTVEVISIPSGRDVMIDATDLKTEKVFVYGEEVDDFRTVDYEGLTTLNISATQELSRLVKKQAAIIESLEKRLSVLESKPLSSLIGVK